MHVAVGERERPEPVRRHDRGQLADGPAGVVADQVGLVDAERIEEIDDHPGLRAQVQRLAAGRGQRAAAVRQQVGGQAPAHVGKRGQLRRPQPVVQEHTVHEHGHRGRPGPGLGVGDGSGRRCHRPDGRGED